MPRISFRRDIAENWTDFNPILHDGEFGFEMDTDKFKIGRDNTPWIELPYAYEAGSDGASAYDVAVANGFAGTEADWLDSLVGPQATQVTLVHQGRQDHPENQDLLVKLALLVRRDLPAWGSRVASSSPSKPTG